MPAAQTPPSYPVLYDFLGHVGKRLVRSWRRFSTATLAVALLGGCGVPAGLSRNIGTGETLLSIGLEGRWQGPVTPTKSDCGASTTGLMSVTSSTFTFDPFQGTTIINGTVKDGVLDGTLARPGANKQMLSIIFHGSAGSSATGGRVITGTLASGRCQWDITLKRG